MQVRPRARVLKSVMALIAIAVLAGCKAEAHIGGPPKVPADVVAEKIGVKLAANAGVAVPKVDCPEALEGKVGTTMRCVLTASDETTVGVTVTVTAVKGTDVKFDIEADDEVTPAPLPTD